MDRRSFFTRLVGLGGAAAIATATPVIAQAASTRRIELQRSPVAGFQYHQGSKLWAMLQVGDVLSLVREADNRFDARAVRVEWQGEKLGYLPRLDNASVSHLLDNGTTLLSAEIVALQASNNPWERIALAVYLLV
ncbi:MAG: HIRAN domain-containing protein [Gallionella sp.]